MNEHVPIKVVELDADIADLLDEYAAKRGLTREAFTAEAIRRQVEEDAIAEVESDPGFDAFIQAGADDIDAGRTVSHEDMTLEINAMIERHRQRP